MKTILFGLSLLACTAAATAADESVLDGPHCVSFAPAGFCDAMQFDTNKSATWRNYDCAGSDGVQTKATARTGRTFCDGTQGCEPAAMNGWDSFKWQFNRETGTGTLIGTSAGEKFVLQQNIPVEVTGGSCAFNQAQGGISSLSR
jgi:hypothetical protein